MSKIKIIWKFLTGGREAVLDYILDTANSLVAKIGDAKRSEIVAYLAQAKSILSAFEKYSWLCPAKWQNAYTLTISAFADVVAALDDLSLTSDEIAKIVAAFQSAYVAWRAD